jgi:hypothetical protein
MHATADEIEAVLGDVDPAVLEQIVETGASLAEVTKALSYVEAEREGQPLEPIVSSRVAAVRDILEDLFDEPDDEAGRTSPIGG